MQNKKQTAAMQNRMFNLLHQLNKDMHERDHILAIALLGAIAGQNTFLYGPPGTAKSLISRRLAYAFEAPAYFECLMNRFTTPEEIFGPVSIKELKEDRYIRQVEGYLPTADFAFYGSFSRFFSSCQTNCSKYSPLVRRRDAARSSAWRYASRSICTQTLTLSGAHRPKGSSSPWGSVKSLLFMGAPSAASYAADGGGFHGAVFPGEGCIIRKKSKQACFFWEKRACLL